MNFLTIENASKSFGDKVLFSDISLYINKGDKVALVARNGAGKTTLLKIISGLEKVEGEQSRILLHKSINLGILDQDPHMPVGVSVLDYLLSSDAKDVQSVANYEKAVLLNDEAKIQKALTEMDEHKAWNTEARLKEVAARLGLNDFEKKVETLSGGQRKRLALARMLFEEPEFLILDEPTNHLDLHMIEWLETYLSTANRTLFMVTHDRYFLDRVCNHIVEIDGGQLHKYQGNYSDYLEKRALRLENEGTVHDKSKKLLKKELDWVRRMPKARGTKNKARVDKFHEIKEEVYGKSVDPEMDIQLESSRLGSKIVELHNASKAYDETVILKNFDYKFSKGDRVGIIGRNGTGKTSLVNLLTGAARVDSGKVVIGDTVQFGYYKQDGMQLKDDKRIIEVIRDIADYIPLKKGKKMTAETLLERFMFPRSQQRVFVSQLSGGEKRRLYLLTVLMANPNFLILDEPTNDLDIFTLNVLEDYLMNFPGCLIIVSHDRYFMDKLVEHLFVLEGQGVIRDFPGTYTEFRNEVGINTLADSGKESKPSKTDEVKTKKASLSYQDKKDLNDLDMLMPKLEKRKKDILEVFNTQELSAEKASELSLELGKVSDQLEESEMKWLELMEKKEQLNQ